jgi:hypothetical protein
MEDIGSVFIYLIRVDDGAFGKKETRVAYSRLPVSEFKDPNAPIKWIELQADKAIGEIKDDHKAGIIGV